MKIDKWTVSEVAVAILYFFGSLLSFRGVFLFFHNGKYVMSAPVYSIGVLCIFFSIRMIRSSGIIRYKECNDRVYGAILASMYFVSGSIFFILAFFLFRDSNYILFIIGCVFGLICMFFSIDRIRPREYDLVIKDTVLVSTKIKKIFMGSMPKNYYLWDDRLIALKIPDTVTSIGEKAFYSCSSVANLVIPDSVTSIGKEAFYGCRNLISVEIPNSVTSIGKSAFYGCLALTNLIVSEDHPVYGVSEGVLFDKKQKLLHTYLSSNKETSYVIPDSVTSIGDSAFGWCRSLESIEIPNSVTSIGEEGFFGCDNLTTIKLSEDHPVYKVRGNVLFDKNGNIIYTCLGYKKRNRKVRIILFSIIFWSGVGIIFLWLLRQ